MDTHTPFKQLNIKIGIGQIGCEFHKSVKIGNILVYGVQYKKNLVICIWEGNRRNDRAFSIKGFIFINVFILGSITVYVITSVWFFYLAELKVLFHKDSIILGVNRNIYLFDLKFDPGSVNVSIEFVPWFLFFVLTPR